MKALDHLPEAKNPWVTTLFLPEELLNQNTIQRTCLELIRYWMIRAWWKTMPQISSSRSENPSSTKKLNWSAHLINWSEPIKNKGYLTESLESYRNGRVLSVPAEYKSQIPGIIHDESDTGKTVFYWTRTIDLTKQWSFWTRAWRNKEIVKIIKSLCNDLSSGHDAFIDYQSAISYLDFVGAKAHLAMTYHGEMPEIKPYLVLSFRLFIHCCILE